MKKPDRPTVTVDDKTYTLGEQLMAPGDWWDKGFPLRSKDGRSLGIAFLDAKGWHFVRQEHVGSWTNPWRGPPRSGPFARLDDIVATLV